MSKPNLAWLTDEAYAKMSLSERALFWAAHECDVLKVQEEPKGSNRGKRVDEYEKVFGLKGEPWCACFVGWCLTQAGGVKGKDFPNSALVADWRKWATEHNKRHALPTRGSLGFLVHSNGTGHIFFVTKATNEIEGWEFTTIEGNGNDSGGREGYMVVRHKRTLDDLNNNHRWGFIQL